MKTVALISGGKDSCFNMMCCVAEGHEIVALANLRPEKEGQQELDSYMFQTVGHTAIDLYAEALGLPLYVQTISGSSLATGGDYQPEEGDEVEDLYKLLQAIKEDISIEAVSVGAILSDYQRVRVENVCSRLGLSVLSFLWRRNQEELLREMIDCGIKAKIIKVAALGLEPDKHLGLELSEILPHMLNMKSKYGLNVCGEGGEYETFVFDCPLFQQKINLNKTKRVIHSDDAFAPVGYLVLSACSLSPKPSWDATTPLKEQILRLPLLTSRKWLAGCESLDPAGAPYPLGAKAGGGDSKVPSVMICVPDVNFTGIELPLFKCDGKSFQVSGIRAVISRDIDISQAVKTAMDMLKECLINHSISMEDVVSVSLCVGDMSNFKTINDVYKQFFDVKPPVRVCIEANLPRNVAMQMDCHGRTERETTNCEGGVKAQADKKVLHVQALSHWAPANIGPYSQAIMTDGKLYMAGIVPLVPATLNVVEGGIRVQSSIALTHVQTVMSVIAPGCRLDYCPMVTCYLTSLDFVDAAKETWDHALEMSNRDKEDDSSSMQPHVQFLQVSALPKGCLVEWHVTAWPKLEDVERPVTVERKSSQFDKYNLHATAKYSAGHPHLFSCSIIAEVTSIDFIQLADKATHPGKMVELYCQVWKSCYPSGNEILPPLAKIFFSPTVFDYSLLHKYFCDALNGMCSAQSVPVPSISLVPVSNLDSGKQILAWSQ